MSPPHHHSHQFAPWQKLSVYTTGTLLLLTGAGWLAIHYLVGAGTGDLPHPLEAWTMRLHGLAAHAGLFLLGTVAAAHVPHGWRRGGRLGRRQRWIRQRRTGLTLCLLAAALAFSGYLLYYFAPERIRPSLGWAHAATGIAMAMALAVHSHGARQCRP